MRHRFRRITAIAALTAGTFSLNVGSSGGEQLPYLCGVDESQTNQKIVATFMRSAGVACLPVMDNTLKALGKDNLVVTVDWQCAAVFSAKQHDDSTIIRPELAGSVKDILDPQALNGSRMWDGHIAHLDEIDANGFDLSEAASLGGIAHAVNYMRTMTQRGCARLPQ